ncbi:MAG: hypothetical protein PHQ05_02580 [Sterolibacterium sp.]|nr:hypothetical protein [Sterolibacterium sp.]
MNRSFVLSPFIHASDAAVEAGRKISIAVNTALEEFPLVSGSIGVAWFRESDRLFPDMLKAADELMYEVKERGKSSIRFKPFTATSQSKS